MAGPASLALTVFQDHARQIELSLKFISIANSVKKDVPLVIEWASDKTHAINEVREFLDLEAYPEQLHCNANYLSLVAAFEEFLRQTLQSAISFKAGTVDSFDGLGQVVQDMHMKATGWLLTKKTDPPQQLRAIDFFEVCRRIGTCLPGAKTFELNIEALCLKSDLLKLDSFLDALQKFGYSINWDILGADGDLKRRMDTRTPRNTAKALKTFITEMTAQRNRIAHTGSSADITPTVFEEYLGTLMILTGSIDKVLA